MKRTHDQIDPSRRGFVTRGIALAAGSATALAIPLSASAKNVARDCWDDDRVDAHHGDFGHLRVALYEEQGRTVVVPIRVLAPADRAEIDLRSRTPSIRIGSGARRILLTTKGISTKDGQVEQAWTKASVRRLLDQFRSDEERRQDLFALRLAVHTLYPEYVAMARSSTKALSAPSALGKQHAESARRLGKFGHEGASRRCTTSTVVDTVTTTLTTTEQTILTAAEQFEQCTSKCFDTFIAGGRNDFIGGGICEATCLAKGFVDVVTGIITIVETITEQVVREVVTCATAALDFLPDPLRGRAGLDRPITLLPGVGAAAQPAEFPPEIVDRAIKIINDLAKSMPGVIQCLVNGDWSLTRLSDLTIGIPGIESIPVGITVCMDRDCVAKFLGKGFGGDVLGIIAALVRLATTVETAAAAGAVAALEAQALIAIIAMIAVLLTHYAIVVGQMFVYESLGMLGNGVCITHPSMPIAVIGAINPVAGILALANVPLIVTPR